MFSVLPKVLFSVLPKSERATCDFWMLPEVAFGVALSDAGTDNMYINNII